MSEHFTGVPYAIHTLKIKMYQWEEIKEKCDMDIMKEGPNGSNTQYYKNAVESIAELKIAIEHLKKLSIDQP